MEALTPKQEAFALNLFKGLSQREAYIQAGYSSRALPATLDKLAYELARSPKISSRFVELCAEVKNDAIAEVQERQETLTEIMRGRFGQFADEEGHLDIPDKEALNSAALHEVKTTHFIGGKDGRASETTTTIKLRDPISAIQELNKMDHIYDEKPQFNDNRTFNIIVQGDEAREKVNQLLAGKRPAIEGEDDE